MAQGSDQQGYSQQQESYAPEQTYGEAAPMFVKTIVQCFQGCPVEAPCMGYGGCVAKSCGAAPVAPVGYGATQQSGYRQLQQQGYGQQESYAAPAYAAPAPEVTCGCPAGTVDTTHLSVNSTVILWIAFALLFIPALYFLCRGFEAVRDGTFSDAARNRINHYVSTPRILAGVVCMVASLAYLTMATGHGFITKCNGRDFYYARYVDWAITTPLMLWDILTIANASHLTEVFIAVMDIFMIVSGLIGELIEGGERWAFFGFSMLAFPSSTSSAWRRTATVYAAVLARTPPTANVSSSVCSRSLLSPGCATLSSGSSPPLAVFAQLAVLSRMVLHPTVLSSPRGTACSSRVSTVSVLLVSSPLLARLGSTLFLTCLPSLSSAA